MDFPRNVFQVYRDKPKFVFSFLGEISHDSYNLVQAIDDDFVDWLRWFEDGNYLNNTLLIVMSDHGPRFVEQIFLSMFYKVYKYLYLVIEYY